MFKILLMTLVISTSASQVMADDLQSMSCSNPLESGGEGMGIDSILIQKEDTENYSITFNGTRFGNRDGHTINNLKCRSSNSIDLKRIHGIQSEALFINCQKNDSVFGHFVIRGTIVPSILFQHESMESPKATGERYELVIRNNPAANGRKTIYRFINGCEQIFR